MKRIWSQLGHAVGRTHVALVLVLAAAVLVAGQPVPVERPLRLKVEASDLLPAGHPQSREFSFVRATFRGSSRGLFVLVEAPIVRLRQVVPEIAGAFSSLDDVDFIRYRVEREYFESSLLLQSLDDLRKQAEYLKEHRNDVARVMARSESLASFLDGLGDVIDGEQELSAATDEAARDEKLTRDLTVLAPFLRVLRQAMDRLASGEDVDPQLIDWAVDRLLLRGWFDAHDLSRLHRELLVPDDVWERGGRTLAIIWVASKRSDF